MRTIAISILALLASGCAAERWFDLVPRDPQAPWQVGNHRLRTESSRASVSMAFDRPWYGYLVFDVEIVNQSTSMLHVDPTQFSYSLASSGGQLPTKLKQRFPALAPEAALTYLKKQPNLRPRAGAITRFEPESKQVLRILDQASKSLLRVTELAPGATVRGELWMPGWPVQHAVGPEEMRTDNSSMATKQHPMTYQGLTLRVPAEVGGQEFDYSIAVL